MVAIVNAGKITTRGNSGMLAVGVGEKVDEGFSVSVGKGLEVAVGGSVVEVSGFGVIDGSVTKPL